MLQRATKIISEVEFWVVALLVTASVVWSALLPAAVISAAFFFLLRFLFHRRLRLGTPADVPILLLLLACAISVWVTAFPEKTLPQIYRLLSGIALFYAIINWSATLSRARWLADGFTAVGFLLALIAPISVQWAYKVPLIPASLYSRFEPLIQDTIHPNVLGGLLILLLPIPLSLLLFSWQTLGWIKRVLYSLALVAMLVCLALSQARGAWMAFAALLVVLPLLRWRWGWLGLIPAAGALAFSTYRLGWMATLEAMIASSKLSSIENRVEIWTRALYIIQDFPLTGVGLGSFGDVLDRFYPIHGSSVGSITLAHNLYLQIAVDLGLPGLIAWLAISIVVVVLSWQTYRLGRLSKDGWVAGLGAGLFCSQLALMLHGLTDAVPWGMVRPAPLLWAIWGLTVAAYKVARVLSYQGDLSIPNYPPEDISTPEASAGSA